MKQAASKIGAPAALAGPASRRRSVNLTIRADIIEAARALKLNASKAAEAGIAEAVKKAREREWLEQAGPAIEAYNERIRKHGPILGLPDWAKD